MNIFNPTRTLYQEPELEAPVRRRNHSLGSQPCQPHSPVALQLPLQNHHPPINSYRKYRIQSKIMKFKSSKANTQRCQENVNLYNSLKKELTEHKSPQNSPTNLEASKPKLYIKDLGILPVESHSLKKRFRTKTVTKSKTQITEQGESEDRNRDGKSIGIKIKNELRPLLSVSPKKYNQLSLRQIVQTEEEAQTGYNFFMKLAQLRKRKSSVKDSRRSSDDYSLQGW